MVEGHAYAGFWRRVAGALADFLIMLLPMVVVSNVVLNLFQGNERRLVVGVVGWALPFAYYVIGNGRGGTWGKRWLGLRVVDARGAAPGLQRALVRAIPRYGLGLITVVIALIGGWQGSGSSTGTEGLPWALRLVSLLLLPDDLWMIWDARKQTLHDKLAGTFVVES